MTVGSTSLHPSLIFFYVTEDYSNKKETGAQIFIHLTGVVIQMIIHNPSLSSSLCLCFSLSLSLSLLLPSTHPFTRTPSYLCSSRLRFVILRFISVSFSSPSPRSWFCSSPIQLLLGGQFVRPLAFAVDAYRPIWHCLLSGKSIPVIFC